MSAIAEPAHSESPDGGGRSVGLAAAGGATRARPARHQLALGEIRKLAAFVRRDLRIVMSYRVAAVAGLLGLAVQAIMFSLLGKLVDPARLPMYGGTRATYMEFATIGIALNLSVVLLLHQLASAIRTEQLIGTLDSLLMTPTAIGTIQAGSAAFELLYLPLRICLFTALIGVLFGLGFHLDGILPAGVIVLAFVPFVWGLGLLSAGAILTFKRGAGALTIGASLLGLASGAFFPLALLPHWVQTIARINPLAIAIRGLREPLIGGTGWAWIGSSVLELIPLSVAALGIGVAAFRLALRRELRNGTLGLY